MSTCIPHYLLGLFWSRWSTNIDAQCACRIGVVVIHARVLHVSWNVTSATSYLTRHHHLTKTSSGTLWQHAFSANALALDAMQQKSGFNKPILQRRRQVSGYSVVLSLNRAALFFGGVGWTRFIASNSSGNLSFSEEKACFSTHFWEIFTVFPPFSDFLVLSFSSAFRHSSFRCITVSLCLL